ncbi:hypothetical protein ILYODFUR_031461 [Ilyodon furcidens]|uniref:Uncharacterized protein n=1 Tax=Ilyodon furcidens TaxID=33524 RepID=A0ABV0UB98_9TELE
MVHVCRCCVLEVEGCWKCLQLSCIYTPFIADPAVRAPATQLDLVADPITAEPKPIQPTPEPQQQKTIWWIIGVAVALVVLVAVCLVIGFIVKKKKNPGQRQSINGVV